MDVRERMQRTLDGYQAGVRVLGVEIEKADPPAQVVDAFRDVQVAEQNADAARNQAEGYAQQVLAQAEGEAEAFDKVYAQYRLAPEVMTSPSSSPTRPRPGTLLPLGGTVRVRGVRGGWAEGDAQARAVAVGRHQLRGRAHGREHAVRPAAGGASRACPC